MAGWVKLHRCLLDKAIWQQSQPEQKTVLITILLLANHNGKQWKWQGEKFSVEPGQFITSLDSLAKKAGVSVRSVRTALANFEKLEFLTNKSTKTGRLITVVNWALYQSKEETPTNEATNDRQSTDKAPTTNKNDKNDKNDKEDLSGGENGDEIPHSLRLQKYISEQLGVFCLAHLRHCCLHA